jgi:GDP-4-dehydro-6-deoxy-D-mannose reductase
MADMSRPTLVTGAAGFAGGHLLDRLLGPSKLGPYDGDPSKLGPYDVDPSRLGPYELTAGASEVVAWHRPGGHAPTGARARWEAVDVLDAIAVGRAIAELRPGVVYHCAGAAHVGRAWDEVEPTLAANVRGTHHVVDALRRADVAARVVIPSSALVYAGGDAALDEDAPLVPTSPYGLSKLAQELTGVHAVGGGIEVMIARAFNHVGPRQDPWFVASGFARRIADIEAGRWQPEIAVGNLDARRDLTDVRDTVRAYQLIAERGQSGRAYNVCSGRAIAIRDLLEMMLARAHVPIAVRVDPARYRPNDTPVILGDPSRIHTELGWTAEIPLEQTIDDLLDDWRARTP